MWEVITVLIIWSGLSFVFLWTGWGFLRWHRLLSATGISIRALAIGYGFFGLFGLITAGFSIYSYTQGENSAYQGIGFMGWVRLVTGAVFNVYVCVLVNIGATRIENMSSGDKMLVVQAYRKFARLKDAVEKTSHV